MAEETAAQWARLQLDRVLDDPRARFELAGRTYRGPDGYAPRHLPFRRAELAFMRWQLRRGVLAASTGSRWWRAANAGLLRDGLVRRSGGTYALG